MDRVFGVVERPGASLVDVRACFTRLVEISSTEMGKLGCLMANSASEVAPYDKRAATKVEKFRNRLRAVFERALSNAKANGELPKRFDAGQAADFLTGVTQGLSVLARSNADPKMVANVVAMALSSLK